ncbi:hypothetical protein LJB99_05110 [Deltaproteobacteria bacterium OttesenSCG-928-K17]|nr:hypothetical protein [Deltaproteobacteria bacterium OttesenSCG-928-K17]
MRRLKANTILKLCAGRDFNAHSGLMINFTTTLFNCNNSIFGKLFSGFYLKYFPKYRILPLGQFSGKEAAYGPVPAGHPGCCCSRRPCGYRGSLA